MTLRAAISAARRRVSDPKAVRHAYDWTQAASLGETVTRTGSATYVNVNGLRTEAAPNTPRYDYSGEDPNTYNGILIEPASSNVVSNPGDILASGWGSDGCEIVPLAGIGMTGGNTLHRVTQTLDSAQWSQTVTVPDGATFTVTWWLAPGTGRWVFVSGHQANTWNGSQVHAWVDLATGLVGQNATNGTDFSGLTHSARKLANGICEIKMTATLAAGFDQLFIQVNCSTGDNVWSGLTGQSYHFDSVQVESNAFGTSFIPGSDDAGEFTDEFTDEFTLGADGERGAESVAVPMSNGSYDILVIDSLGGEWRNAVTVSGGSYNLTPRTGMLSVVRLAAYDAGALTQAEKDDLLVPAPFGYTSGLRLTFADEFDDTNLARISDTGEVTSGGGGMPWRSRYKHGGGGFSSATLTIESQIYTNGGAGGYLGINPFSISNSVLTITAAPIPEGTPNVPVNTGYEPDAPYKFYSGMISSEPNRLFTYGVFEARCRSDAINGTWPAFWLVRDVDEPKGGEVDVLENIGDTPTITHQTYHEHEENNGFASGTPVTFPAAGTMDQWHTYAVKWERGKVSWYLDGKLTKTIERPGLDNYPMILIANLALNTVHWLVGPGPEKDAAIAAGTYDPDPADLPTVFEIDWIRVYQDSETVSFQNGAGGYSAAVDTMLSQNAPTTSYSTATLLNVGLNQPTGSNQQTQVLLRFDNIFGNGPGQIPSGRDIYSAVVELETTNTTLNPVRFHRMLQSWSPTDTWNSRTAGISTNGTEAVATADLEVPHVKYQGFRGFNVTASLQAWSNGQTNNGWVILAGGTDTWEFRSSEGSRRPKLTVTYADA